MSKQSGNLIAARTSPNILNQNAAKRNSRSGGEKGSSLRTKPGSGTASEKSPARPGHEIVGEDPAPVGDPEAAAVGEKKTVGDEKPEALHVGF